MTAQPGPPETIPVRLRLSNWFTETPGTLIAAAERAVLRQILPDLFGYHIVQIGRLDERSVLDGSRISHQVSAAIEPECSGSGGQDHDKDFVCAVEALPIAADSVDVVVMPHVLEFERNPHQILREIERILIAEGHVIITGFNPWSLFGLWRILLGWRENPPWSGRFIGAARVKDWLQLLGFDIASTEFVHYRPPLRNPGANHRLAFLEKLGRHVWPYLGGVYVVLAKKRLLALTPVRMLWRARRHLISSGVAEPSTRSGSSG